MNVHEDLNGLLAVCGVAVRFARFVDCGVPCAVALGQGDVACTGRPRLVRLPTTWPGRHEHVVRHRVAKDNAAGPRAPAVHQYYCQIPRAAGAPPSLLLDSQRHARACAWEVASGRFGTVVRFKSRDMKGMHTGGCVWGGGMG